MPTPEAILFDFSETATGISDSTAPWHGERYPKTPLLLHH
jgi:hypothetical protein